ncbi:MAG: 2-amino-4-hydroxy-6-hydroxymethyldihydropteridine diphosphokinase [Candidatus Omnitrophota bacterium]
MVKVIIAFGSNSGNRRRNIKKGLELIAKANSKSPLPPLFQRGESPFCKGGRREIRKRVGGGSVKIILCSPYYETEPVEGVTGKKFLNGVLLVETALKTQSLLRILQEIEEKVGRPKVHQPKESRNLDLDIIYYGDRVINKPNLQIPHPKRLDRWFVIKPAAEVAPDFYDPILKKKLSKICRGRIHPTRKGFTNADSQNNI